MKIKRFKILLSLLIFINISFSQNFKTDSTILFQPTKPLITEHQVNILRNVSGFDLIISTNGFGLGFFYGYNFTDNLTGKVNFSISEAKDEKEVEVYNPWTGELIVPFKVNRFLVFPLFFAVEYRLFKDEIMDNFKPYISAAAGPTLIYSTPYDIEFFSSLKHGKAYYTAGGYFGAGAYFGSETKSILGVNVRYYFIPYNKGIESLMFVKKKEFGGFSISLSFGTAW